MNTARICSGCQKPLEANGPDGLCPECLLKAGLGTGVDMGPDSEGGSGRTPFVAPSLEEVAGLFPQVEILGFIGQGGMGAVYKARQKSLDRVVALKILPPGIGKDAAFAERFTREAKALARLNHPGVVTIYEFGQVDGLFFFLMEFVDGMSLRHLLEVERISAREALAIVPQICDALQYAHDQGIVHRDIKPENILLDRQGRVKVADFGLAKLVGTDAGGIPLTPSLSPSGGEGAPALTDAGKVMGTPQYMAPEQREHPTEVDHRADIYSLGVVFYQMLTGELPGKPIEPPSSRMRGMQIDVRLDEVVLRALEKKPELRYQQVSQVKGDVETIATSAAPGRSPKQVEVPPTFPKWLLFRIGLPKWPRRGRPKQTDSRREQADKSQPPVTRSRLRAALIVGVLVWLFVTGTATLITWIRPESWKVVAVISCPHSQAGRPVQEHFKFIASMIELIRSDVILGRVIDRLELDERSGKLDERWGKRNLGLKLTKAEAMVLLKRRLDVRSEGGTLIQVGVFGKRPEELEEAMDIANTIAEELRAFRIEQHESPADMLEMTLRFTPPYILLGLAAGLVLGLLAGGLVLWRGFSRRGSQASQVKTAVETTAAGVPATEPPAVETAARFGASGIEQIRREVKGPAIGLLVTAILNWILIPVAFTVFASFAGAQPNVPGERPFQPIPLLAITALGLCSFIIYAAVKMMRLEARGAALVASVLAIIVTPGNIIGMPLGIWALVTLNRREVRAAFTGDKAVLASALGSTARPHAAWPWVVAAVGMVVLVPVVLTSLSLYVPALARKSALRQQRLASEQVVWDATESRISEVHVEGQKAIIRAWLDDLHELRLFIGTEELGWSVPRSDGETPGQTSANGVRSSSAGGKLPSVAFTTAAVELSDQIRLADGSMGRGLIFETKLVHHYIAITPDGSVPDGEVVFRPNSAISNEKGAFTFADIRQSDRTLISVSICVRPVSGRPPGSQSFGPVIERVITTFDADDQGFVFFDLETDNCFKPPFPLTFHRNQGPAFVELTPELKQWIEVHDVDLLLHLGERNWDLMTLEMRESLETQHYEWERSLPEQVIGVFAENDPDHLVRNEVPDARFGYSYQIRISKLKAFQTRRNTMGVYQFKGLENTTTRGVRLRYKQVLEAGETAQSPGGGPSATSPQTSLSKTFLLRHMLASEMAEDLRQILLGRFGMEARPAPDNMQLTVTAPPDVLNRVSTFVFVADWPKRIAPGPDYYYPREDVEQAGRSFFYACSIEDIEGVARMLAPGVLAELKGTNLTAHGVLGEEKDAGLLRQLRGNWEGKEAAVRRVVQAWNRFPLRRLQVEPKTSISFELRYFTSAAFEGAPKDWVDLSFIPDRSLKTNTKNDSGPEGPLLIDTLPPWLGEKEAGLKGSQPLPDEQR